MIGLSENPKLNEDKEYKCKGLVFRASESKYLSSFNSIETKKSLRLLKKDSCPGCYKCENLLETLREEILDNILPEGFENTKPGRKYKLVANWHPGTYEYPDEGELVFSLKEVE